jgi:hypothetical protein
MDRDLGLQLLLLPGLLNLVLLNLLHGQHLASLGVFELEAFSEAAAPNAFALLVVRRKLPHMPHHPEDN